MGLDLQLLKFDEKNTKLFETRDKVAVIFLLVVTCEKLISLLVNYSTLDDIRTVSDEIQDTVFL